LAEDQGDGKLERELSSTQGRNNAIEVVHLCFTLWCLRYFQFSFSATYHLALATGDVANGGTEAVPYIQIFGERGDTGVIELRKEANSGFVRGKTDFFNIDAVDVGRVRHTVKAIQCDDV
jgi:hypothetical protein